MRFLFLVCLFILSFFGEKVKETLSFFIVILFIFRLTKWLHARGSKRAVIFRGNNAVRCMGGSSFHSDFFHCHHLFISRQLRDNLITSCVKVQNEVLRKEEWGKL